MSDPIHELPDRKRLILRAVILEYVSGAEPVASDLLTVKYDLGVKSATVRNELAEMSEWGYLEQPHTSAGRIPSDKGYRFYIDHLLNWKEPNVQAKNRVIDAADDREALRLLLEQTTRALSRVTHLLSAATTVRHSSLMVRSAVVSAFGPKQALVVVGLGNGEVLNKLIDCPAGLTLADIGHVNDALLNEVVNRPVRGLQRSKPSKESAPQSQIMLQNAVWAALRTISREFSRGTMTTHGEEYLFGQPEFTRDAGSLAGLLDQIKESDLLFDALQTPTDQPNQVTIGRENRHEELYQLSLVRQSFYIGNEEAGVIALIGPTRMDYDSGIPLVQFTAKALTAALSKRFES